MDALLQAEKDVEGSEKFRFVAERFREVCKLRGISDIPEFGGRAAKSFLSKAKKEN
jgi:hypothetical protein